MQTCERCGGTAEGFKLLDYCTECSRNLCAGCMTKGCCGVVPADSGMKDDYDPDVCPQCEEGPFDDWDDEREITVYRCNCRDSHAKKMTFGEWAERVRKLTAQEQP